MLFFLFGYFSDPHPCFRAEILQAGAGHWYGSADCLISMWFWQLLGHPDSPVLESLENYYFLKLRNCLTFFVVLNLCEDVYVHAI